MALVTGDADGVFTGTGVVAAHPAYSFDPAIAGAGFHSLTYTVNNGSGCTAAETHIIEVLPAATADASLQDVHIMCAINPSGNISLAALLTPTTDAGGTFAQGASFDANASIAGNTLNYNGPGCYEIEYSVSTGDASVGGSCAAIATSTAFIYISEAPQPSFDITEEVCWDGIAGSITLTPVTNSPIYTNAATAAWSIGASTTTAVSTVDPATGLVTVNDAGVLEICLTETITNPACNGVGPQDCVETTCHTISISRTDTDVSAGWTPSFSPICVDGGIQDLVALVTGNLDGIFTGNGVIAAHPAYSFDPVVAGVGTHSVTYTVNNSSGCTIVETHLIEVLPTVDATVNAATVCEASGGQFDLTALMVDGTTTLGGTFTASAGTVSGDVFTYTAAGPFPIIVDITYTVGTAPFDATNGCGDEQTVTLTIIEQPEAAFDTPDFLCELQAGDAPYDLNDYLTSLDANYSTGTPDRNWVVISGTATINADGTGFNPTAAGTVVVQLTETFSANGVDCSSVWTETISIADVEDPTWTNPSPVCEEDLPLDLSVIGAPVSAGGTWSGLGIMDATLGTFNPPGEGAYLITYTVGEFPCESELSQTIEVFPVRSTDIKDVTVCESPSASINLSAMLDGADIGGAFTVVTTSLNNAPVINNDVLDYIIDFSDGVGPHTITIEYALTPTGVGGGCDPAPSQAIITITGTDDTGFDLPDSWCVQDGPINFQDYTALIGGTWSFGDGVTPVPATFPTNADFGLVEIIYNPDVSSCGVPSSEFIEIIPDYTIVIDPVAPLCPFDEVIDLTATITNLGDNSTFTDPVAGGLFSGPGITDNVNGTFVPSIAVATMGQGTYTITYTYTNCDGCCSFSSTIDITVEDQEVPTIDCPADISTVNIDGACYAGVIVPEPTNITDNCTADEDLLVSYISTYVSGAHYAPGTVINSGTLSATDLFPVGVTEITWTVIDEAGNRNFCTTTVEVVDDEAPDITYCPEDVNAPNDLGQCGANVTVAPIEATDNCAVDSYEWEAVDFYGNPVAQGNTADASGFYSVGITDITWTVSDIYGNTATCSTRVIVSDVEDPTITCPADITVLADPCTLSATSTFVNVPLPTGVADNCAIEEVFNNFNYTDDASGDYPIGTTTVTYSVTDIYNNFTSCSFTVTVEPCCEAQAGDITVGGGVCPGEEILLTTNGTEQTGAGYEHYFLIVDANTGLLVDVSNTSGVISASVYPSGNYIAYSYSVKTGEEPNPAPTVGSTISDIGTIDEGCYDISAPGTEIFLPDAFPSIGVGPNTFEGANGGVGTYYYNVHQIEIVGGTQPYTYVWDNTGYVRHTVTDNATGDGVILQIIYSDSAIWNVTITDANGCTSDDLVFTNDPGTTGSPGVILDIYDYETTGTTTGTNGVIDISVEGGTTCANGDYTYQWAGPEGWTGAAAAAGPVINNLPSGWYTVTVTDCGVGNEQQSTIGWYWVEPVRRGRGKVEVGTSENLISAYPNPFTQTTTIEFSVVETGNTQLSVYSIDGREVAQLFNEVAQAGETYPLTFAAKNLVAGIYIVQLTHQNGSVQRHKLVLSK